MAPMERRSVHVAGILVLDIADCFVRIWQSLSLGTAGSCQACAQDGLDGKAEC